jgi:4-amino-4-deoxy-L-arabinose transferase-like glycosyltransferase
MGKVAVWGVFAFGALAILFSLGSALCDYPPFRDQHLGAALLMVEKGISFKNCQIVGFNANHVPTIQEVPLWQAGAALAMLLAGGWWGGANLFSLGIFALAVPPVYQMGKRLLGKNRAWWAPALFLAQPVVFDAAGLASPDGMSLVAALWAYDRIRAFALQGGVVRGIVALGLGAAAACLKAPFFMAAGLAAALEVLPGSWRLITVWTRLVAVAMIAAFFFAAWTRYTDQWLGQALWPLVDLRLSHNPEMVFWYFGDWAYRLSPMVWAKAIWKASNSLLGSFALAGIAFGGWMLSRNREGRAWLAAAALTTAIFIHLVFHHRHYYLMFSPAVALAMSAGSLYILDRCFPQKTTAWSWSASGFLLLMAAALVQGLVGREIVQQFDPYPREVAQRVARHTQPADRLLIVGGGWGGEILFRARREGLSIWNTQFLEKPENLKKAQTIGFNKLVLIRESPLLEALQKSNPGGANYTAPPFSSYLSAAADGFPLHYQDSHLMIRLIPSL